MRSKLSAAFFAVAAVLLVPFSAFANTLYFPQVVFGQGYSTTFTLTNTGTTTVTSTLTFYDQSGNAVANLNAPVTLAAGSSTRVTLPNTGSNITTVWAELAAGSGTVQGVASFELRNGTVLQTIAGVLGVDAGNSFLLPVDVSANGSLNTGVALANTTTSILSVRLRLMGEDGSQIAANTTTFGSFSSRRQSADFVTSWFQQQLNGQNFRGTLVVETVGGPTNALVATALTAKEGILSALAVIPGTALGTPGRAIYFPQVVFGQGYSTTVVLLNTGATTISSSLNFYTQAGTARADLSQAVTIPANGSARVTLPDVGSTITTVWGEFSPGSGTAKGVAAFDLRSGGRLQTTAGVLGLEAGDSFNLPIDMTANGSSSTGIAIANVSGTATFTANLKLLNESGVIVSASTAALTSGDEVAVSEVAAPFVPRQQVANFIPNWFPTLQGTTFKGVLVIDVPVGTPPNSLVATALTVKEGVLSALAVNTGTIAGTTSGGGGGGGGGGGVVGGGAALACLDPNGGNAATMVLNFAISGSVTGTNTSNITVNPNVTFQGNVANEYVTSQTTTYTAPASQAGTYATSGKSYSKRDINDIVIFGATADLTSPLPGTVLIVYNPPYRDKKYTLNPGESVTTSQTSTTTTTLTGLPSLPPQTTTTSVTVQYLGQESVTIPAGTFNACKFVSGGTTSWESVGKGVPIKSISLDSNNGTTTMTFTSGTLNGAPLVP